MPLPSILLVEDNQTNRRLFETLLRRTGLPIFSAASGEEAIQIALREHPTLILMDLILPNLSGIEAIRQLKADPSTAQAIIVALTASTFEDERAEALSAGCVDCINKPVDPRQFAVQVQAFLPPTA